jgi:hypothetical protein
MEGVGPGMADGGEGPFQGPFPTGCFAIRMLRDVSQGLPLGGIEAVHPGIEVAGLAAAAAGGG